MKDNSSRSKSTALIVHKKKQKHTLFILSKDALTERKTRSVLTILMVLVGGGLMVALNAMSAGNTAFINKQLNSLAPNIMFVSSGQHGFHGTTGPPTIIINSQIVNRIKSLPFVQEIVPEYRGTVQLNAQGNIQSASVTAMDPSKLYMIDPNLQLVPGSIIKSTDPTAMVVGNTVAYPREIQLRFYQLARLLKLHTLIRIRLRENQLQHLKLLW